MLLEHDDESCRKDTYGRIRFWRWVRKMPVNRIAGTWPRGLLPALLIVACSAIPLTAAAQSTSPAGARSPYGCEMVGGHRFEGSRVDVVFRPSVERIVVRERFALSVLVCPHAGVTAPASVVVDATMPEQRHGMNYKPSVKSEYGGRQGFWYRAEGLMFHTPGRWELQIDVRAGGRTDRFRHSLLVE
jgi:hypothetical protein